ncbi:MAG: YggS family pyridoxal phosphate-dependent enzyme [Pyrinomonadaceae bacterium]
MTQTPESILLNERIDRVRARIIDSSRRAGRSPEEITLVAVSKTHPVQAIQDALSMAVVDFGENRVQEAETKIPVIGRETARWHLIGHLQSNKARRAVELFDVIHSLDSASLAIRLNRVCEEANRAMMPVLIQLDLGHEATKTGVDEAELPGLVNAVQQSDRLQLIGLMTLPPFFDQAESARPYFRRLRELRDELQSSGAFGDAPGQLSMGMTHDFEIAIEEGATIVRVGTAIFGTREVAARP